MNEPNTGWEEKLASNLQAWVGNSTDSIAKYFQNNLDTLKKLAKEYPQLFMSPKDATVYRGTRLKLSTVEKLLKAAKKFESKTIGSKRFIVLKGVTYKPNRPSQSWTLEPAIAYSFSKAAEDSVPVVLIGKTDSSFIFSPKLTATFFGTEREKEVVRVAGQGLFDMYLPIEYLKYTEVLHNLPLAKPYFQQVVDKCVEFVRTSNQAVSKVLEKQDKLSVATRNKLLTVMVYMKKAIGGWADPFDPKKDKFPIPTSNIKTIDQLMNTPSRLSSYRATNPLKQTTMQTTGTWRRFDLEREYEKASNAFIDSLKKRSSDIFMCSRLLVLGVTLTQTIKTMKTINNWFTSLKNWVAGLFSDEKGTASSKRFVGILCSLTLCATLYSTSLVSTEVDISTTLIDSVALLAFGCLGLTSIDKFIATKSNPKPKSPEEI